MYTNKYKYRNKWYHPLLLRDTSGLFGTLKHYYSFLVCHGENSLPSGHKPPLPPCSWVWVTIPSRARLPCPLTLCFCLWWSLTGDGQGLKEAHSRNISCFSWYVVMMFCHNSDLTNQLTWMKKRPFLLFGVCMRCFVHSCYVGWRRTSRARRLSR